MAPRNSPHYGANFFRRAGPAVIAGGSNPLVRIPYRPAQFKLAHAGWMWLLTGRFILYNSRFPAVPWYYPITTERTADIMFFLRMAGIGWLAIGLTAANREQPVEFPHNKHAAKGLECIDCHITADAGAAAGMP